MNRALIFGATAVVSAALGAVGGYALAVRRLNDTYNEMMEEELRKTREYYERNQRKFPDPATAVKILHPEEAEEIKAEAAKVAVEDNGEVPVETLERIVKGLKYNQITPAEPKPTVKIEVAEQTVRANNIFTNRGDILEPEDDKFYDEMMDNREHETIYLVTQEEHMENPHEFESVTLTYFAGDNVLAEGDENKPVEDSETTIGGVENLQFGRWSKDANVVYIRNEHLGIEYEILRSTGKYTSEVLGLDS